MIQKFKKIKIFGTFFTKINAISNKIAGGISFNLNRSKDTKCPRSLGYPIEPLEIPITENKNESRLLIPIAKTFAVYIGKYLARSK